MADVYKWARVRQLHFPRSDFLFQASFDGLLVRRRRPRREFGSLDVFPGLSNVADKLRDPESARAALKELRDFCSQDRCPDPTQLCALGLFGIVSEIFRESFDSPAIVDSCLRIFVHFTHSEFDDFFPFSESQLIGQLFVCLQSPVRTLRRLSMRIFTNLFSDAIRGSEFMEICSRMGILGLKLSSDVVYRILIHYIESTSEAFPDELAEFIPFIEMMVDDLTQRVRKALVDCLSCLLLDRQCCLFALRLPQFTLEDVLKTAVIRRPLANLFAIINSVVDIQESIGKFADGNFLKQVATFLATIDPAAVHSVCVFVDSLVEEKMDLLNVSGVIEQLLLLADGSPFESRRKVAFVLVHLVHCGLRLARYPAWMARAFRFLLDTVASLSENKKAVALAAVLEAMESNGRFFLPIAHTETFEATLQELADGESEKVAPLAVEILATYFDR
jgi:hypothetical protein